MTAGPARPVQPGDLLFGDDHDFVVNAYIALLGRWPDDAGYAHYLAQVRNRPEARVEVLRALAGSEEARRPGAARPPLELPDGPIPPSDPRHALAAALDLRTRFLRAEVERLREAVELLAGPAGPEFAALGAEAIEARDAALRSEIEAVRREARTRLGEALGTAAGGGTPPAGAEERAAAALSRLLADYVGDLLAASEARFDARLRAVEARLLALGAAPPGP